MSIEEVRAERFAQLFHHYHQALMTDDNGSSNPRTESWDQVPQQERRRLVSAARQTLLELSANDSKQGSRDYFASRVKLVEQPNVDKLEVADFRMIPNAKHGHKGKVFVQFPFSFFGFAWRGGDVKARHVAGHLPFGSI
jgi:hypothetical protein